ncbi:hypothetical protein [Phormidium tenue]|jgi:hypothetical protein|uniref:Uncharacterized protein n=1 Tax=Phormidium tenue FACHB-1050 TaxID=2692857 RepID=A0ABR8CES3_9CYAN|nr:hypothetical protein [Phormidium tenue]MBD2318831.1 hypothetical protein [Phormidium tenue FACHB-1050]
MTDWVEEYEESIFGQEAVSKFFNDLKSYDETLYTMLQEAKDRGSISVEISETQLPLVRDFFKAYPLHQELSGCFEFKEVHPVAIARLEELKNWRKLVTRLIYTAKADRELVSKLLKDNFNSLTDENITFIRNSCDKYPAIKKLYDKTLSLIID